MNWLFTLPFSAECFQPTLLYADKSAAKAFLLLIDCRGSDGETSLPVEGAKYSKAIGSHFLYSPEVEDAGVIAFKTLKIPETCTEIRISVHPWRNSDPVLSCIGFCMLGLERGDAEFQITIPGTPIDE